MFDETVYPGERFALEWRVSGSRPLDGTVLVTFLRGLDAGPPGANVEWKPAEWAGGTAASTARPARLPVAGSVARQANDAHPGVGDWTPWVRLVAADGAIRERPAGKVRFH